MVTFAFFLYWQRVLPTPHPVFLWNYPSGRKEVYSKVVPSSPLPLVISGSLQGVPSDSSIKSLCIYVFYIMHLFYLWTGYVSVEYNLLEDRSYLTFVSAHKELSTVPGTELAIDCYFLIDSLVRLQNIAHRGPSWREPIDVHFSCIPHDCQDQGRKRIIRIYTEGEGILSDLWGSL